MNNTTVAWIGVTLIVANFVFRQRVMMAAILSPGSGPAPTQSALGQQMQSAVNSQGITPGTALANSPRVLFG